MTYADALEYMYAQLPMFHRVGPAAYKKDLGNIQALCTALGDPHLACRVIHVAGTNGKGSVSHLLSAYLQMQGYRTGLCTSPHYRDFRERIKIDGQLIPESYVTDFIARNRDLIEKIAPSFFELTTAMAFAAFRDTETDWAVIETGLGGRLDSSNIVQPQLCVITNISYDHQNMLGDTLQEIAGEKAGIIKPGIPVIIGERDEETADIFIGKAASCDALLSFASDRYRVERMGSRGDMMGICIYRDSALWLDHVATDLIGNYQLKNIATWCAVTEALGMYRDEEELRGQIRSVLPGVRARTGMIGRMALLGESPLILADSAHNEAGIRALLAELDEWPYERLHIVYGTVSDKDPGKILELLPKAATYYFAKAAIPRGMEAAELAARANEKGLNGNTFGSVRAAFECACAQASDKDMVLVCGSIFVVAEVI